MLQACRLYAVTMITLVSLWLASWGVAQAEIRLQGVTTVDVAPSGFSVVWQASPSTTPRIAIYTDAAGTIDITQQLEVLLFPLHGGSPALIDTYSQEAYLAALRTRMQTLGIMKIQVRGGRPETTYYYRVYAAQGSESAQWPVGSPVAVTTMAANAFVSAQQLFVTIADHPDPRGWLVTVTQDETLFGVSAVVGDGASPNQVSLDVSNMFAHDRRNWTPQGVKQFLIAVTSGLDATTAKPFSLTFTTDFAVSRIAAVQLFPPGHPEITVSEPAQPLYTTGQSMTITWVATAPSGQAHIALYYDTNQSGADGTLITGGLAAAPPTETTTYLWDTTGVADGVYYVYATITDGSASATSYAPGALTIDRQGTDSDGDAMADAWERHHFGTLARDGTGDFDGDGTSDRLEYAQGTNPMVPDVRFAFRSGLNLIAVPVAFSPARTSADLLTALGPSVLSLSRLNVATHRIETTQMASGVPQGDIFPIHAGEGYYLEMAHDQEIVLPGLATNWTVDLTVGVNLVGLPSIPPGYDAFQLLRAIGDADTVASLRRFNPDTGRYETAVYHVDQPVGVNFPIQRGAAYLISVRQAVQNFGLP